VAVLPIIVQFVMVGEELLEHRIPPPEPDALPFCMLNPQSIELLLSPQLKVKALPTCPASIIVAAIIFGSSGSMLFTVIALPEKLIFS